MVVEKQQGIYWQDYNLHQMVLSSFLVFFEICLKFPLKLQLLLFNDDLILLSVLIYNNQSTSLAKFIKSIQTFNQKVAQQWAYENLMRKYK